MLTDTVIWDLDGVAGSPDGGVDEQTERHHPQGQDRGTGCHTDTEEGRIWTVLVKQASPITFYFSSSTS